MSNVPQSLDEAINLIVASIDPDEFEKTKQLAKTMDLNEMAGRVHHTLGMFFRNEFNLWHPKGASLRKSIWDNTSPERRAIYDAHWKKYDRELQYQGANMHADDASHEMLVATLKRIREM